MPGKSSMAEPISSSMYKPTIYLEDKQIPSGVGKVGEKVMLMVEAKVTRMTERQSEKGTRKEISLEVQKISFNKKGGESK